MKMIITASEKGRIVIPATIRRQLKMQAKTKLFVQVRNGEIVLTPAKDVKSLYGALAEYAVPGSNEADEREAMYRAVAESNE